MELRGYFQARVMALTSRPQAIEHQASKPGKRPTIFGFGFWVLGLLVPRETAANIHRGERLVLRDVGLHTRLQAPQPLRFLSV